MVIVVSSLCNCRESKVKIENSNTKHSQNASNGLFYILKEICYCINDFSLCHSGFALEYFAICILQYCNLVSFYGDKSDTKSIW